MKTTDKEKAALKTAINSHKKLRKNPYFKNFRDDLIRNIIGHKTPDFGSLKVTITKGGI